MQVGFGGNFKEFVQELKCNKKFYYDDKVTKATK